MRSTLDTSKRSAVGTIKVKLSLGGGDEEAEVNVEPRRCARRRRTPPRKERFPLVRGSAGALFVQVRTTSRSLMDAVVRVADWERCGVDQEK